MGKCKWHKQPHHIKTLRQVNIQGHGHIKQAIFIVKWMVIYDSYMLTYLPYSWRIYTNQSYQTGNFQPAMCVSALIRCFFSFSIEWMSLTFFFSSCHWLVIYDSCINYQCTYLGNKWKAWKFKYKVVKYFKTKKIGHFVWNLPLH